MTIILVMKTESLAETKANLSRYVDEVENEHARVTITRNGRPAAVLVSIDDLAGLEETLDVVGDASLMRVVQESLAELGHRREPALSALELRRLADAGTFDE